MSISAVSAAARVPQGDPATTNDAKPSLPDPLAGRVHVLGKPVRTLAAAGFGVLGAAAAGGLAFAMGRGSIGAAKLATVTAGAAVGGGLAGVALTALIGHGPRVGAAYGRNSYFVKTGTEQYNTTCTSTSRVSVGDTDGDGFPNYRTVTTTYPCVKVRDVGYNEWRGATGSTFVGRRKGSSRGYETRDAAVRAPQAGPRDLVVRRADGRYYLYKSQTSGLQQVDKITASVPGVTTW